MGLIVRVEARHTTVDNNAAEAWAVDGERTSSDGVSSCCSRRHTGIARIYVLSTLVLLVNCVFNTVALAKYVFNTMVLPAMMHSTHW